MIEQKSMLLKEKREYVALDVMRLVASLLVVAIHIPLFAGINLEFSNWFTQIVCRIAVPFFFITSGFFLGEKIRKKDVIKRYLGRLVSLYIGYSMIYLPIVIHNIVEGEMTVHGAIKNFFYDGLYFHLWYFLSLIVAVGFMYLLYNYMPSYWRDSIISVLAVVLYILGTLYSTYTTWLPISFQKSFSVYSVLPSCIRNGLFWGFPLLAIGIYIKQFDNKIRKLPYLKLCIIGFLVMVCEVTFLRGGTGSMDNSMLFSIPFVVTMLFLAIAVYKVPEEMVEKGKRLRSLSVLVYGGHLFVERVLRWLGLWQIGLFWFYWLVVVCTIVIGIIVLQLASKDKFAWLKNFY